MTAPWHPMSDPIDLKHLGKLAEELGEAQAAVARCIIQGVDEVVPGTGKPNKQWLEEELADVLCGIKLVIDRFRLDNLAIVTRVDVKARQLREWHKMA